MEINKVIKEIIINNKAHIQLYQWSIASGICSLLYSEFLRRLQRKTSPKDIIFTPTIRSVEEFLSPNGQLMNYLSNNLIDQMIDNNLFQKHNNAPELKLFINNNDILKTIVDLHILPNMCRTIPDIIKTKFSLEKEDNNLFYEDSRIDIFDRKKLNQDQLDFVIEEILLQLLVLLPSIDKDLYVPEDNMNINLDKDKILLIGNEKAICNIYFNYNIIENKSIIDLLSFITSTTFEDDNNCYKVKTSTFNNSGIILLKGIIENNINN